MISDGDGDFGSQESSLRLPSLPALRCFEAAALTENFSKAAVALHLTHGAISRAVRALEDDLGVVLFERGNRRVRLTDAGRRLHQATQEGFGLIQRTTSALRAHGRRVSPLVLSCEPTLLMRWLIPRWPAFEAQHPAMPVHLVAGGGPVSFGSGIDLAIRRNDFAWPSSVNAVPLFNERIGPVCSPRKRSAYFALERGAVSLRSDAVRLHTRTRPQAWRNWDDLQARAVAPGGRDLEFEHFYFSLQAAVAGLGVAIGPWHLVQDDIASGVLAAPLGFIEDGSTYFLLAPQRSPHSAHAPLLDWLRASAADAPA